MEKRKKKKEDKIKELIQRLAAIIIQQGGEKIIDILYDKKNVNEFIISKKLDLTINQTRNILYKLLDNGLVSFIRKKDKKKGGWYTYFWTLNIKESLELLKSQITKKIKELEEDLGKRKIERFYHSPAANLEYTEEEALEHNFICPETGEVLQLKDNSKLVSQLEIEISKLRLLIDELNKEMEEIQKKETKSRDRRFKREEKKKKEKRKKMAKERKRAKEKIKKTEEKKIKHAKKIKHEEKHKKISKTISKSKKKKAKKR